MAVLDELEKIGYPIVGFKVADVSNFLVQHIVSKDDGGSNGWSGSFGRSGGYAVPTDATNTYR